MSETGERIEGEKRKDAKTDLFTITTYTQRQRRQQRQARCTERGNCCTAMATFTREDSPTTAAKAEDCSERPTAPSTQVRGGRVADFQPVRRTVGRTVKRTDGQALTLRNF